MSEILKPRPASTVLMLRDTPEGYELLMLKRNLNSDFVGGAYVFPGGGVDPSDAGASAQRLSFGISDEQASTRLGISDGGLAYYVACLRELFEEAGLLLACDEDGNAVALDEPELRSRLIEYRRQINDRSLGFVEMMERENLRLDMRGLEYIAHWVTPVGPPRRYDTRFFVALAPTNQVATHDAGETVADQWVRPVDALAAHERGELEMIFPTIKNLQNIAHFNTASDVMSYATSLTEIPCVLPKIFNSAEGIQILLPGDPGFDD